jgi:hypothetical protein
MKVNYFTCTRDSSVKKFRTARTEQLKHDYRESTVREGQDGQNMVVSHNRDKRRNENKNAGLVQLEQDSHDRTAGQDSRDRRTRTGWLEYYSMD